MAPAPRRSSLRPPQSPSPRSPVPRSQSPGPGAGRRHPRPFTSGDASTPVASAAASLGSAASAVTVTIAAGKFQWISHLDHFWFSFSEKDTNRNQFCPYLILSVALGYSDTLISGQVGRIIWFDFCFGFLFDFWIWLVFFHFKSWLIDYPANPL